MMYEERREEMAARMTAQPPPSVYYDERGRRLTVLPDPSRYREPELMEQFPILAMIVLALRAFIRDQPEIYWWTGCTSR